MKKILMICLFLSTTVIVAQKQAGIGIKAGLNYNSNGEFLNDAEAIIEDPMKNLGFHVGLFGKIDLKPIFLRPEVLYTRTSTEYESGKFYTNKVDVPILAGIDILGPLSVFAGPSLQYILNNEFEDFSLEDAEKKFTVGAQFGVGINFKTFGIDLRYERGLTENEVEFTGISQSRVDARPEQLILGISALF